MKKTDLKWSLPAIYDLDPKDTIKTPIILKALSLDIKFNEIWMSGMKALFVDFFGQINDRITRRQPLNRLEQKLEKAWITIYDRQFDSFHLYHSSLKRTRKIKELMFYEIKQTPKWLGFRQNFLFFCRLLAGEIPLTSPCIGN